MLMMRVQILPTVQLILMMLASSAQQGWEKLNYFAARYVWLFRHFPPREGPDDANDACPAGPARTGVKPMATENPRDPPDAGVGVLGRSSEEQARPEARARASLRTFHKHSAQNPKPSKPKR